jgi:spermidine/putrescine transport system permease protein
MKAINKIYTALILLMLYAPILVLMLFSFNSSSNTGVFTGFSLYWYRELFSSAATFTALKNTLILAVSSALLSTAIGTMAALGLRNLRNKYVKGLITSVTNIPMMNPDIVTGISMMLLFVFVGSFLGLQDKLNFWTLLIAHITFNLPYVILNVLPKLRQTDVSLYEAAMDLGCTPVKAFFKVIMPAIMPGVVSGALMAFTLSLDDFVISYYTTGADFQTLPLKIFAMTKKTVKPDMYALSSLIFITILVLLIVINVLQEKSERKLKGEINKK